MDKLFYSVYARLICFHSKNVSSAITKTVESFSTLEVQSVHVTSLTNL